MNVRPKFTDKFKRGLLSGEALRCTGIKVHVAKMTRRGVWLELWLTDKDGDPLAVVPVDDYLPEGSEVTVVKLDQCFQLKLE